MPCFALPVNADENEALLEVWSKKEMKFMTKAMASSVAVARYAFSLRGGGGSMIPSIPSSRG